MNDIRQPFDTDRPALQRPLWLPLLLCLLGLLLPSTVQAEWRIVNETDATGVRTPVAEIHNDAGYKLAIYRDAGGTIRARFRLNDRLYRLHESICPSYQIDQRQTRNSSVSGQPCLLKPQLSEYVLGTIDNNRVVSRPLYELMNGSTIDYRFQLQAGGYDETSFSLAGSKRTLLSVLGLELEVLPR